MERIGEVHHENGEVSGRQSIPTQSDDSVSRSDPCSGMHQGDPVATREPLIKQRPGATRVPKYSLEFALIPKLFCHLPSQMDNSDVPPICRQLYAFWTGFRSRHGC